MKNARHGNVGKMKQLTTTLIVLRILARELIVAAELRLNVITSIKPKDSVLAMTIAASNNRISIFMRKISVCVCDEE